METESPDTQKLFFVKLGFTGRFTNNKGWIKFKVRGKQIKLKI